MWDDTPAAEKKPFDLRTFGDIRDGDEWGHSTYIPGPYSNPLEVPDWILKDPSYQPVYQGGNRLPDSDELTPSVLTAYSKNFGDGTHQTFNIYSGGLESRRATESSKSIWDQISDVGRGALGIVGDPIGSLETGVQRAGTAVEHGVNQIGDAINSPGAASFALTVAALVAAYYGIPVSEVGALSPAQVATATAATNSTSVAGSTLTAAESAAALEAASAAGTAAGGSSLVPLTSVAIPSSAVAPVVAGSTTASGAAGFLGMAPGIPATMVNGAVVNGGVSLATGHNAEDALSAAAKGAVTAGAGSLVSNTLSPVVNEVVGKGAVADAITKVGTGTTIGGLNATVQGKNFSDGAKGGFGIGVTNVIGDAAGNAIGGDAGKYVAGGVKGATTAALNEQDPLTGLIVGAGSVAADQFGKSVTNETGSKLAGDMASGVGQAAIADIKASNTPAATKPVASASELPSGTNTLANSDTPLVNRFADSADYAAFQHKFNDAPALAFGGGLRDYPLIDQPGFGLYQGA